MLEEFKEKLKIELVGELPGEEAQMMMMPTARNDQFVLPSHKSPPIQSAVLILFYPDEHGHIKFPLIQRPTYNGAHSGQIALPGGKAEESDADLFQTALREANEEIGIEDDKVEVIGQLTNLHISVSNYLVTPVVGFLESRPEFELDGMEVVSLIESDLYDIIDPNKRKEGEIIIRGKYKINTPYFDIDDKIVWGATAMMLSELSTVISKTGLI